MKNETFLTQLQFRFFYVIFLALTKRESKELFYDARFSSLQEKKNLVDLKFPDPTVAAGGLRTTDEHKWITSLRLLCQEAFHALTSWRLGIKCEEMVFHFVTKRAFRLPEDKTFDLP